MSSFLNAGGLDFIGGAANGLMSLVGGGITNYGRARKSQQKLNAWNFENITKPQMALEQEYNEKNMAIQNQYAIDAENRANAYNDPSAQLARARSAGMNPQSVVSDAGVQGSISSAPSSDSPSGSLAGGSAGTKDYSALGKLDILGMIQQSRQLAQNLKIQREQQDNNNLVADSQAYKNYAEGRRALGQENRDVESWQTVLDTLISQKEDWQSKAKISRIGAEIQEALKDNNIESAKQSFENLKTQNLLDKSQIRVLEKKVGLIDSEKSLNEAKTKTEGTVQELNKSNKDVADKYKLNIEAKTETEKVAKRELEEKIKNFAKDRELTDAQIRQIKNQIALDWAEFGVDTAHIIAEDVLSYLTFGFAKKSGSSKRGRK